MDIDAAGHRTPDELAAGFAHICDSPADDGPVELLVCRPAGFARTELAEAVLDLDEGMVGDNWRQRGSRGTPDGSAHPGMQLTLMNARVAQLVAGDRSRWGQAGDQVYVDLDLGEANLPVGARLSLGTAVVEVSGAPHRGCKKFTQRFGLAATRFVNSPEGSARRLRGLNTAIVEPGIVRVGDVARRIA